MREITPLPLGELSRGPAPYADAKRLAIQALADVNRVIVVLDDDPTGVQTVHDVNVYTAWDEKTVQDAFRNEEKMFFILTNSRGLTTSESREQHTQIAKNIAAASKKTGKDFFLVSRSDSTLRGHWPMETEVLRQVLEEEMNKKIDGEIICPFFPEGGRYTMNDIHYVLQENVLVPAGSTEFAKDKSFGYSSSSLPEWCEEKSNGRFPAKDICTISLEELRTGEIAGVADKLEKVTGFGKIIVNCTDYADLRVFVAALCTAVRQGKEYIIRSAAAVPKILGGQKEIPLLKRDDLVDQGNRTGGIVLIGSHVNKTTRQLEELKKTDKKIVFIQFDQHRVLEEDGLEKEVQRVLDIAEAVVQKGTTATVYTRRERLDLSQNDPDMQLKISVQISDALTSIIGRLKIRPAFIIAKGGITSSDVGTKALAVRKALVKGQIRPGIPVWQTGPESKFPGLPYVIFPGNVGSESDLRNIVETLID